MVFSIRRPAPLIERLFVIVLCCSPPILFASCSKGSASKPLDDARSAPARVVEVTHRGIRRNVEAVGSLYAFEEVVISSEVEGKVDEVLVDVGDRVEKGQPLVKISTVELKLTLEQQRATLQQARARLGLPEGGEDIADVRQAAEVKRAAADLNDVEQKYNRAKALYEQQLLPRQSYDEAEARYKSSRAAYELAVQGVQNLRAQLAQHRASAALAEKKLTDSIIRAPFAGQVKERTVTPGQYLKVQTPVMVVVNVDPLRVRLKIPERMVGWIKVKQAVSISVEAYPDKSFNGELTRINPSVDQQTRSFEAEALISNRGGILKPGFFVRARIPSERVENVLLLPEEALRYVYGVYKVYAVEGGLIKEREVKPGEHTRDGVEIIDGLAPGDRVAIAVDGRELIEGATIETVK